MEMSVKKSDILDTENKPLRKKIFVLYAIGLFLSCIVLLTYLVALIANRVIPFGGMQNDIIMFVFLIGFELLFPITLICLSVAGLLSTK